MYKHIQNVHNHLVKIGKKHYNFLITIFIISIFSIFVIQQILTYIYPINENFDIYDSDLTPSVYPDFLLLEDTYNVNKTRQTKNMPGDYLYIERNKNTKDLPTPDNGLCSPMDVCGLYINKKNLD
tara:strand:- start:287 stop:661 length:375 start_codon:yes stop_codon:yes gene_type:complete